MLSSVTFETYMQAHVSKQIKIIKTSSKSMRYYNISLSQFQDLHHFFIEAPLPLKVQITPKDSFSLTLD